MGWPAHQVNGFVPSSTDWNAIVDALSQAQGAYNGNGQVASGWLQINITPTANANALQITPAQLISAGTQSGGVIRWRANSYDTANHTRDFTWQVSTTSNAGAGFLGLYTQLDGGAATQVFQIDSSGVVLAPFTIGDGFGDNYAFGRDGATGYLTITPSQNTFSGYIIKTKTGGVVTEVMRITNAGFVGIGKTPTAKFAVASLPSYANNAAAITGGQTAGDFYTVTGTNPLQVAVVF